MSTPTDHAPETAAAAGDRPAATPGDRPAMTGAVPDAAGPAAAAPVTPANVPDRSAPTRAVLNQAPPLQPTNYSAHDVALLEGLRREGGAWGEDRLREIGALAGTVEARQHGERAEKNEPRLVTHDRYGNRVDEVELDPSWHWMLREGVERGLTGLPWRETQSGGHVVRAAMMTQWGNVNGGVLCPISMTYAVVPALRDGNPELAAEWEPRLTAPSIEHGAIAGMAMTERQGGSDVRANITTATPVGGDEYEIWGHKWFCSYPPCDIFLVLAQIEGAGVSCFLVERGPGMEFQRLKDKLGSRSLPSSEVEFRGIRGRLVGQPGKGVKAIIRMVNHTRLDCLIGSTTSIRRGTVEAIHHARHRAAFGARLVDQPAMANVLADLALESEASTAAALRIARAYDDGDAPFRRFATAVMKYYVCKRAAPHASEALECLGGNGFVEDSGLPLLYRDAPLMSIWEGSGNVAALDVLRAMATEPEGLPAFLAECDLAAGADARFDEHLALVRRQTSALLSGGPGALAEGQFLARRIVEDLAVALQASLLLRHAPEAVADGFCAARLGGGGGRAYGTLPVGVDAPAIVDRALPA